MSRLSIESCASPNCGERLTGPTDILLLHYTGMVGPAQAALDWLRDPQAEVSAHYFIFEDGRILQLVDEARRAWHAGASAWCGETDVNSRSIGVEIANEGHPGGLPEFPDAQVAAVIALAGHIVGRHPIPPHRVLAHSDVSPDRKLDPGELFPWGRLAQAGIGRWTQPARLSGKRFCARGDNGPPVEALQAMLALYGYGVDISGIYDEGTANVVAAFQRHFRPERVDGVADHSTVETLSNLLEGLP